MSKWVRIIVLMAFIGLTYRAYSQESEYTLGIDDVVTVSVLQPEEHSD